MKKLIALALVFVCVLGLIACGANKHTCRHVNGIGQIDFQSSSLSEPFVTDDERDALLNKAIKEYLDNAGRNSASFTYEIIDTQFGVSKGKETILYWLNVVDGNGFAIVLSFIIQ